MLSARRLADLRHLDPGLALLAGAALILAFDPALWLVATWRDPAYDSNGFLVFLAAAALLAWSATSPVIAEDRPRQGLALALILVSATVRLAGQVLAINTVGALCLILDVYALGLLLRLSSRARPISPAWLAVVFAFSLPLERVVQRTIGYALQHLSAGGACGVLDTLYGKGNVTCEGVRILLNGADVLVDLPCSGARTLLWTLLAFAASAALCRPTLLRAVAGFALTLASALVANILRITVLAIGIAEPARLGGLAVMEQPWHDLIGLGALALGCLPLMLWSRRAWSPAPAVARTSAVPLWNLPAIAPWQHRYRRSLSLVAIAGALVIVNLPRTPVDVARREVAMELPLTLAAHARRPVALEPRERAFFEQFGGWAAKATYGPHTLMLVRTTSPLRHLHTPDDCLRGLGFRVTYLGTRFTPVPVAIYRATAPDGTAYRIDVTFVSDRGEVTGNVATAVWRWLNGEARAWTAVQWVSPEHHPEHEQWAAEVRAALEIFPSTHAANERGGGE
jgi:exosortase/archaeosortase family protein